jgi:hypothetical protein
LHKKLKVRNVLARSEYQARRLACRRRRRGLFGSSPVEFIQPMAASIEGAVLSMSVLPGATLAVRRET